MENNVRAQAQASKRVALILSLACPKRPFIGTAKQKTIHYADGLRQQHTQEGNENKNDDDDVCYDIKSALDCLER